MSEQVEELTSLSEASKPLPHVSDRVYSRLGRNRIPSGLRYGRCGSLIIKLDRVG
jgi:hypothetical protein